jgi:prolyl oligopeptidase PreP (S9A serine peptidase family)
MHTGYGGFAISADPFFNPIILTFLQMYSAIFAVPSIRGGGEFGEEWHRGGRRENRVCEMMVYTPGAASHFSNREIVSTISLPPRMTAISHFS